jgi:hypothetical protein
MGKSRSPPAFCRVAVLIIIARPEYKTEAPSFRYVRAEAPIHWEFFISLQPNAVLFVTQCMHLIYTFLYFLRYGHYSAARKIGPDLGP